jgi:tetratricopeptide (TPR) repeat protein
MRNLKLLSLAVALFATLAMSEQSKASSLTQISTDSLVMRAQEMVYSDPGKLDSLIGVIEGRTLAKGDSFYFVVTTSLRGIRATMLNDYGPALKYFYDVWKFAQREGDSATQVQALMNMAGVSQVSGRYIDAKKRLVAAVQICELEKQPILFADITMALGIAEVELNQHDSAIANFRKAIAIYDDQNNKHAVLSCMSELGYALEAQHRYRDALDIYKRMDVLYAFTEDVTGEIVANQRKGGTLMHLGRMREARESLEYSLALADSFGYEMQKDSTLLRLIKANAALGDIAGAERYTKRLVAFIQGREEKKNQELIAFVEAKYNLEEKARANESLVAELKATREDLSRTQLYLRFAIAGMVVLFLSILVLVRRFGTVR